MIATECALDRKSRVCALRRPLGSVVCDVPVVSAIERDGVIISERPENVLAASNAASPSADPSLRRRAFPIRPWPRTRRRRRVGPHDEDVRRCLDRDVMEPSIANDLRDASFVRERERSGGRVWDCASGARCAAWVPRVVRSLRAQAHGRRLDVFGSAADRAQLQGSGGPVWSAWRIHCTRVLVHALSANR